MRSQLPAKVHLIVLGTGFLIHLTMMFGGAVIVRIRRNKSL